MAPSRNNERRPHVVPSPRSDRFVPFMLQAQITAPRITQVVATSKRVLFPNGYPSPPPIDPTPEEQVIMREQLETRLLDLLSRMSIDSTTRWITPVSLMHSTFSVGCKSDFRSYSCLTSTNGEGDPRPAEFPSMQHSPPHTHP